MSILDVMERAVERVETRLRVATCALSGAGIAYAVVGGNAVAAWVATVDEDAVRNTRDVDVMIRREDLGRVRAALEPLGFVYRHVAGMDVLLDGPTSKVGSGVHIVFAGEMVREGEPGPNPLVQETAILKGGYPVLSLEALVRVKLTANRPKDQAHVVDLLDVGLIDAGWAERLAPVLAERLRALLPFAAGSEGRDGA